MKNNIETNNVKIDNTKINNKEVSNKEVSNKEVNNKEVKNKEVNNKEVKNKEVNSVEVNNVEEKYKLNGFYFSDICNRASNQDNFYANQKWNAGMENHQEGDLFIGLDRDRMVAVFDGMGGEAKGDLASRTAAQMMKELEQRVEHETSIPGALAEYYQDYMRQMKEEVHLHGDEVCGTTCAGLWFQGFTVNSFWVGDSRVYLLRGQDLYRLTRDDSVGQGKVDAGKMTEEEARETRFWHMLTAYMGDEKMEYSFREMELEVGDRMLLCSDGIIDVCTDKEISQIMSMRKEKAFAAIKNVARQRASDNSTAIFLELEDCSLAGRWKRFWKNLRK